MRPLRLCTFIALVALSACSSSPVAPAVVLLSIASGNQQTGAASTALPLPLTVTLTNESGQPVAGQVINWIPNGAIVAPGQGTTNALGQASTMVTLGAVGGTITVKASAGTSASVTFSLTVIGPEPLIKLVASVPLPLAGATGVHDTYVRDGLAFVSAWNSGLQIYDVGDGRKGGLPNAPIRISSITTASDGLSCACVHNSWWFHNPVTHENRYVFVGQEAPGTFGFSAAGDLHVIDIANINAPVEVATLSISGAGVHNFWMDEARQILYAAYYNGGVIAVDVSGTLSGTLNGRIIAQVTPGGSGNTYVWGVHLINNTLYISDMLSGVWALDPLTMNILGGGNNVPDRFTSDLWGAGNYLYSGTWSSRFNVLGNTIKIWNTATVAPVLVDSLRIGGINTVSDVGVTPDGRILVATGEGGSQGGLYLYDLADPRKPSLIAYTTISGGLHTGKISVINGRTYVFAAKNPGTPTAPAWVTYDITGAVNALAALR